MGLALKTKKTVAIACTSGSAVLNYASAISEAFYQKIPLLIITADRPPNHIDIGDGQTIRQNNIYANYIKKSYQLPLNLDTKEEFVTAEKIINEALNTCNFPQPGPVHINIPFDEPIYNISTAPISGTLAKYENTIPAIAVDDLKEIANKWNKSKKVLLIAGQSESNNELKTILQKLSEKENTVILTETTSNLYGDTFIDTIDNVVSTISENEIELFKPDLIISFSGQIVSKKIKKFLRDNKALMHLHISPSGEKMDTYFSLTNTLKTDVFDFFNSISNYLQESTSDYSELWQTRKNRVDLKKTEYLSKIEYSDLKVFESILKHLPENCNLHLGNSTPVRYSQLFGSKEGIIYNSNRGVSGIDGQVSTAVGYAYYSEQLNVLITGDLGFLYDSNGLMNNYLKPNLKIIVINNSGGGIFRFIPGPDTTPNMEEFFVAKHNWKAEYICKAFDVGYFKVESLEGMEEILPNFLNSKSDKTELLEIFTPANKNAKVLREYFSFIGG